MPDLKARFDIIRCQFCPDWSTDFIWFHRPWQTNAPSSCIWAVCVSLWATKCNRDASSNQRAQDAWQVSASAIILRILPDLPAWGWELSGAKQSSPDGPKGDPPIPGCVSEWGPWPPELPTLRAAVINHVLVSHPAFVVDCYTAFLGQQAVVLHYQKERNQNKPLHGWGQGDCD